MVFMKKDVKQRGLETRQRNKLMPNLTRQEREFIAEYVVDFDHKRAAEAVGLSKGQGALMLKKPLVKKVLKSVQTEQNRRLSLKRNEILNHLAACALRNGKQFVDQQGRLLLTSGNLRDLPDEITCAIDSIKQKRRTYHDEEGNVVELIETELKLCPKLQALEMAMKHKSMFPSEKIDHTIRGAVVTVNWADMLKATNPLDSIEDEIVKTEQRLLGNVEVEHKTVDSLGERG